MPAKTIHDLLYTYHTQLQGVANDLAKKLDKIIGSTDTAVLNAVLSSLVKTDPDIKREMNRLKKLVSTLSGIRAVSFEDAKRTTVKDSKSLINIACDREKAMSQLYAKGGKFNRDLTNKQKQEILDYQPFDGQSISQWFSALQTADLQRLTQAVQSAAMDRLSLADIAKKIRGTKENGYTDGILNTSRASAQTIARTIVNGVSNQARLGMMLANADVIDGVKFLATLDGKTCPFCAVYDGKVWTKKEYDEIRRPPLHRGCRCTVIPYIDVGEELTTRPAANADFDQLAKDAYNQNARDNGWDRRWDDLSQSTRLKYYYQAQKDFEANTGKPAYHNVSNDTTFKDYFANQPSEFQRSWLGGKRYELYTDGKLPFDKLVSPDTGHVVTLKEMGVNSVSGQNQRSPDEIRQTFFDKIAKVYSGDPETLNAFQTFLQLPQDDRFWLDNQTGSLLHVADEIRKKADEATVLSHYEQARLIARQRSGVVMTADDILQKIKADLKGFDEEIEKISKDGKLSAKEKETKTNEVKRRRNQLVIDTWIPFNDPKSSNRKTLAAITPSNERFVECTDGEYLDTVVDGNNVRKIKRGVKDAEKKQNCDVGDTQAVEDGLQFYGRICDNIGTRLPDTIDVDIRGASNRGFHLAKGVRKLPRELIVFDKGIESIGGSAGTIAHEFTHSLEAMVPGLNAKVEDFYVDITTNPKTKKRFRTRQIPKCSTGEMYRESNIPIIDTGNHAREYTLKEYGDGTHHELLTMFVQLMFSNPYRVITESPEFFEGMMKCLK